MIETQSNIQYKLTDSIQGHKLRVLWQYRAEQHQLRHTSESLFERWTNSHERSTFVERNLQRLFRSVNRMQLQSKLHQSNGTIMYLVNFPIFRWISSIHSCHHNTITDSIHFIGFVNFILCAVSSYETQAKYRRSIQRNWVAEIADIAPPGRYGSESITNQIVRDIGRRCIRHRP